MSYACLHVSDSAIPRTVACQAPLSMGFSEQEYENGLLFPTPGHLPAPGIEPVSPVSPALQVDSLPLNHQGSLIQEEDITIVNIYVHWGTSVHRANPTKPSESVKQSHTYRNQVKIFILSHATSSSRWGIDGQSFNLFSINCLTKTF